jgi:prolyl-tRNA synthetase
MNDTKLTNILGGEEIYLADESTIREVTGASVGFAGPVGLSIPIIADLSIKGIVNGITGANETDKHLVNVSPDKDFEVKEWADLRTAKKGDACPTCGAPLDAKRGLELGHVFKLGTKYTDAFDVSVLNEENKPVRLTMGCYGIGVNRTLAAIVEQHHDEKGIVFPISAAPYEVIVISLDKKGEAFDTAETIYTELGEAGIDVLFDDRNERAGIKFNDADLLGIPIRIVIGKRGLANNTAEFKLRRDSESEDVALSNITDHTKGVLERLYGELNA